MNNTFYKMVQKGREIILKNPRTCEICGAQETIYNVMLKYDNGKIMCNECAFTYYENEECEDELFGKNWNTPDDGGTKIMTRQEQKQEAIERMKMLKLHGNAIREFETKDVLNLSENGGILYWLNETQKEYVKEFERKNDAVVYHVIRDYTTFGELLAFLYVSNDKDEWGYDRDDLDDGYACVYVKNLDDDMCSEFGSIGIKPRFGGLIRTE